MVYKGQTYNFGRKDIVASIGHTFPHNVLTYSIGGNTQEAIEFGGRDEYPYATFFPAEWGFIESVYQTVCNNESSVGFETDKKGFVYVWSIHFTNGILPVVIRNNTKIPEWNFDYYESYDQGADSTYNSAYFDKESNKWLNAYAYDGDNAMYWERGGVIVDYISKHDAHEENWDEGRGTSVFTERYDLSILNGRITAKDRYFGTPMGSRKMPRPRNAPGDAVYGIWDIEYRPTVWVRLKNGGGSIECNGHVVSQGGNVCVYPASNSDGPVPVSINIIAKEGYHLKSVTRADGKGSFYDATHYVIDNQINFSSIAEEITLEFEFAKGEAPADDSSEGSEEQEPESYAVYDDGTLTFYHDNQRSLWSGKDYDLNENYDEPQWLQHDRDITKAVFDKSFKSARPTTTYAWFKGCANLTDVEGFQHLKTNKTTNMAAMFEECGSLTNLDVHHLNANQVTDMSDMFRGDTALVVLTLRKDLSENFFHTSNVTDMSRMFEQCRKVAELDLLTFNTTNVTDMHAMFLGCSSLKELDVSGFNTSRVTTMEGMFRACSGLDSLDISNFDTQKVENMTSMFQGCTQLGKLVLGNKLVSTEETVCYPVFDTYAQVDTVEYTGDIPISINSQFFSGVGTPEDLAKLIVPSDYKAHFESKFNGNLFYGGYFTLGDKNDDNNNNDDDDPHGSSRKAYVVYNDSTLTFYCDKHRSSRQGMVYDLNTGNNVPGWNDNSESITKAVFDASFANARPLSTSKWFFGCHNLTELRGMEYLNTSNVTNMSSMFRECTNLTTIDLSHFNTTNVESMGCMFQHCRHIEVLDLSSFNTENVIDVNCMFFDCQNLVSVDLSSFNTGHVKYFSNIFQYCYKLAELDLSNFNTMSAEESFYSLFAWCNELAHLSLGSDFVSTDSQDCSDMFRNCRKLATVTFTGDIPSSINSKFFEGVGTASNPATLDVPAEYRDHYAAKFDGDMFYGGYFTLSGNSPQPDAEPYVVYNDGTLTFYYDNQRSSRTGTTYDLDKRNEYGCLGWYDNRSSITKVVFDVSFADARPTSTEYWFYELTKLTTLQGMANLNTSEVTDMSLMFRECSSLKKIDLSHFNTEKVTTMTQMFNECRSLISLNLSSFSTPALTATAYMFHDCSSLTTLDVSTFDTQNVTMMNAMFSNCTTLQTIEGLENFNTAKVTCMGNLFEDCKLLKEVDLSSFDTGCLEDVSHMWGMFYGLNNMFGGCSNLEVVTLGEAFVSSDELDHTTTFKDCEKLTKITFTGNLPAQMATTLFSGIGTEKKPATLSVPEQYKSNYAAKFDGDMFYGGYFTLTSGSGVSALAADGQPFDIYSINGTLVRKGATSLEQLPRGMYLVRPTEGHKQGQKVVIR